MNRLATIVLTVAVGLATPFTAAAAPITATYNGAVAGGSANPAVLATFPVGTPFSFSVTFDDGFLALAFPLGFDPAPVSGSLNLGGTVTALTGGFLPFLSFSGSDILVYGFQFSGVGPQIAGGGDFFGLFLNLNPALGLTAAPQVGYGYTTFFDGGGSVTSYGYVAGGEGGFRVRRAVPAPPAAWLMLAGLAAAVGRRFIRTAPRA